MEHLTVGAAIDYVAEVGGSLRLEGERLKLRLPGNCPAENTIVKTIRANRDAVVAMLRPISVFFIQGSPFFLLPGKT